LMSRTYQALTNTSATVLESVAARVSLFCRWVGPGLFIFARSSQSLVAESVACWPRTPFVTEDLISSLGKVRLPPLVPTPSMLTTLPLCLFHPPWPRSPSSLPARFLESYGMKWHEVEGPSASGTFTGLDIDGASGVICVSRKKIWKLRRALEYAHSCSSLSGDHIGHLVGQYTWATLVRRPGLSVAQAVYSFQRI
jgi:hypothetical protein